MHTSTRGVPRRIAASFAIATVFAAIGVKAATNSCVNGACNCKTAPGEMTDTGPFKVDVCFVEAGGDALAAAGYFAADRVDAAALQERLLARSDVEPGETLCVVARLGEAGESKRITEYIYPTEYNVRTKPCTGIECVKYVMREVGVAVHAETALTDVEGQLALKFDAEIVDEPEWISCGVIKADGANGAKEAVSVEQPIFPAVRFGADAKVRVGGTCVFGGVAASRKGDENKFVLAFVKVDRVLPAPMAEKPVSGE